MAVVRIPIDEWMPVLRTMREIGRVQQVQGILGLVREQASADELIRFSSELEVHAKWLEQAISFEREHGADSMIDKTHPVYVKVSESTRRFSGRKAESDG
jgi:hypothetical protein